MPTATRPRTKSAAPRAKTSRAKKSAPKSARSKSRAKQPAKRAGASRRTRKPATGSTRSEAFASWGDLASAPPPRRSETASRDFIETVTRKQFLTLLFVIAVLGTLYVHHIYSTDRALAEVQAERTRYERLSMQRSRLQAELAAASSPQVILPRAQALGLEEGIAYGPVVSLRSRGESGSGE